MAPSNTASTYFMHLLLPSVDVTPGRLLCRSAPWQVSSEWLSELRASLERTNEFFTSMSEQVGDERFRQIGEHPRPAPATISLPGISKDLDPMGVATDLRLRGPCSQVFHLEPAPAGGGSIGGCKRGAPAEPGLGARATTAEPLADDGAGASRHRFLPDRVAESMLIDQKGQ